MSFPRIDNPANDYYQNDISPEFFEPDVSFVRKGQFHEILYQRMVVNSMSVIYPSKSFGLKFIPNQSDLFRNLFPRQSELIRVNPKKLFNLVWCNSVKNQSVSIQVNPRLWIRMNPDQSFNRNESEVGILRIDSDWEFRLNHSDLGFIWIKNFFRINSGWKSRIESDWFGLNFG